MTVGNVTIMIWNKKQNFCATVVNNGTSMIQNGKFNCLLLALLLTLPPWLKMKSWIDCWNATSMIQNEKLDWSLLLLVMLPVWFRTKNWFVILAHVSNVTSMIQNNEKWIVWDHYQHGWSLEHVAEWIVQQVQERGSIDVSIACHLGCKECLPRSWKKKWEKQVYKFEHGNIHWTLQIQQYTLLSHPRTFLSLS